MPNTNRNKIKVSGNWSSVTGQYVKVNGVWKAATAVYTKVAGTWRTSYPYPLSADTSVSSIVLAGTPVPNGGTVTVPHGSNMSVSLAVTPTNPASTVSGGAYSWTVSNGTWTSGALVYYVNNPSPVPFTVTAEDGVSSSTYTVYVRIADPAQVTIYWAYCSGYNPPVTGSGTVSGTSDATTACNQKKAELGNPSNWVCQGGSAPTAPNCGTEPPPVDCGACGSGGCVDTNGGVKPYYHNCFNSCGQFCSSTLVDCQCVASGTYCVDYCGSPSPCGQYVTYYFNDCTGDYCSSSYGDACII